MDKLHWEVSSISVRDGTYFGYGWVFHEEKEVREVRLKVGFANGKSQSILAGIGKPRDDVAANFPAFAVARHSGFFLMGCCYEEEKSSDDLSLLVTFEDGVTSKLGISQAFINNAGIKIIAAGGLSLRQFVAKVKRNLYLCKRFEICSVAAKIKRYFGDKQPSYLAKAENIRKILDASELQNIILVIDHDLGGGANHYRERLVTEKVDKGTTVLMLSCAIETLSFVLIVRSQRKTARFLISGYTFILDLANQLQIKEIIYNTGVTFTRPEALPPLLLELKKKHSIRLTLLVHDFFMVCPSHFLIDDTGKYCGIPEIGRCHSCLVNNQQDFSSLYRSRDMVLWRGLWGNVIGIADEIQTFSESSLKLLQRAYPALNLSKVVVRPHKMSYLNHVKINPSYITSLRIGVVGHIGYHKGAKVVRDIACEIKARDLNVQIVVIGTIEAMCEPSVVSETGPYFHDKLQELIEGMGVNIMLFPSIWPETFSYVVHELIQFELPIACFDFGAAAERVRTYEKGLVLEETTAPAMLDSLISFHKHLYLSN